MTSLPIAVQHYLHDVLGVPPPALRSWAREAELPYFLRDAFETHEFDLLGQSVVLAIDRKTDKPALGELRLQLDKLKALAEKPVLYCTGALASYERKRLIEQKVPFVVPGNQLYLPELGIDLREYFRQRDSTGVTALSPSAQAMLIAALLRQPWQTDWQPSEIAVALGYTPMTLSRAVKELTAAGIATPYTLGRTRYLRMALSPQQIWEQARPMLRTPVKRSVWVRDEDGNGGEVAVAGQPRLLAGLSALAHHSMLDDPKWPVYALSPMQWRAATKAGIEELPEPAAGACQWQLWSYTPALPGVTGVVDLLSLMLSLQGDPDERIQIALNELKEQLPW